MTGDEKPPKKASLGGTRAEWTEGAAAVAVATVPSAYAHSLTGNAELAVTVAAAAVPLVAGALVFSPYARGPPRTAEPFLRWRRWGASGWLLILWQVGAVLNVEPLYALIGPRAVLMMGVGASTGAAAFAFMRPWELTIDDRNLGLSVGGVDDWMLSWKDITLVRLITRRYPAAHATMRRYDFIPELQVLAAGGRGGILEFWEVSDAKVDRVAAELARRCRIPPGVQFIDERERA